MSLLIAAYLILWIGLFAYLVRLGARLRRVRAELASLAEEPDPRRSQPAG
jgi:CcmD family protein